MVALKEPLDLDKTGLKVTEDGLAMAIVSYIVGWGEWVCVYEKRAGVISGYQLRHCLGDGNAMRNANELSKRSNTIAYRKLRYAVLPL